MALLQLRDAPAAASDATQALQLDPTLVKCWLRRAAARNALGQHQAAERDLQAALLLQPDSREALAELRKTRENVRACRQRGPRVQLPLELVAGPGAPSDAVTGSALEAGGVGRGVALISEMEDLD
jgi:tetratricopeptide (TPR) repeat protein